MSKWQYDNFRKIKKHLDNYLEIMGSNISRQMMINGTLPLGASQRGKGKYKKGENSVRKDISKSINTLPQAVWRISTRDRKKSRQFAAVMFSNPTGKEQFSMTKMSSKLGVNLKVTQFSPTLHKFKPSNYQSALVLNKHSVEKYKIEESKNVGKAKSGWVSNDAWFKKRQKWIRRHGKNGSFTVTKDKVIITNKVPYATSAVIQGAEYKAYKTSLRYAKRLVDAKLKKVK